LTRSWPIPLQRPGGVREGFISEHKMVIIPWIRQRVDRKGNGTLVYRKKCLRFVRVSPKLAMTGNMSGIANEFLFSYKTVLRLKKNVL